MTRLTTLFFALALVAAACGSDSPPLSSDDTAPPPVVLVGDEVDTTHADENPEEDHSEDANHEDANHEDANHEDANHEDANHDEGEASGDEVDDHQDLAHDEEDDHAEEGDVHRTVEVVMTEFAFEPSEIHVSAGESVRFTVTNDGAIEHEFRITTEHAAEEHIEAGHEDHADDASPAEHGHDEMLLLVAAGETASIDITFHEKGEYDIVACLLPGHFEAGMKGALEYEA